jgi:hypothetical protein
MTGTATELVATGRTYGTLAAGGAGNADGFVLTMDFDGNTTSLRQIGTTDFDDFAGIAVGDGFVYLAGMTRGTMPGETNAGANDGFVLKLAEGGAVVDDQPPTLAVTASPGTLWPANNQHHAITLSVTAEDEQDSDVTVSATVVSSEPDADGGNGQHGGDIRVTRADGSIVTSSMAQPIVSFDPRVDQLELRAERSPSGAGRTYTIRVTATDGAGNSAEQVVTVVVPHDRR